ncbi:hypothetical protein CASFOL_005020 [Castilleja foliolosa]|uniref:RING-type E3 ubiquitin transferase n=1 Tax=Castilleja foliolosa TaxID=1961234 RepID=A0ABD3E3L1_9LAMI
MNRASTPSQPETMRMCVLTEGELADITDSSETIGSDNVLSRVRDEPTTVQPQDAVFQMPPLQQPMIPSYVESQDAIFQMLELVDSSGRINFDDILSWLLDEPATVQSQDAMFQMSPPQVPETTRMSSPVLTEAGLAEGAPASVQSQDDNFPSVPLVMTLEGIPSFVDSSGRIDFDAIREWRRLERLRELHPFIDSSGAVDFDAIRVWQALEPHRAQPRDASSQMSLSEEPETTTPALTEAGFADINDSSGRIDFNDISLRLEGEPASVQSHDILPPRQPETTSHEAYQSKGLSVRTISKYLKTMSDDEIRAHDIDGDRKICAVCLDDVCGQKDKVAILDECGHEFHYCCLKKWLRRKNICPICRRTAIYILQDR